jgi:hypothetical protein
MSLNGWLARATRGLSKESAARVREEIGAHFAAAREAALAHGAGPDEAARGALRALGDARAVSRAYRRTLLTAWDARLLARLERAWPPRPTAVVLMVSLVGLATVLGIARGDLQQTAAGAGFALFMAAGLLLPVDTPSKARVFRVLRCLWLAGLIVTFRQLELALMFAAICSVNEWRCMVLRRKLPVDRWPRALYL